MNMSAGLKYTFLIHIVVAVLFGLPLLLFPGQFLGLFGWAPVDPLLSRVVGAALLAHAWSSFRAFKGLSPATVAVLLEMEVVFTVLSGVGLLRHLLIAYYPLEVWLVFALFVVFAIAWTVLLFGQLRRQTTAASRES
jgi:hypothetical protein